MARPDGRMPTRGIQNPITTKVEIYSDGIEMGSVKIQETQPTDLSKTNGSLVITYNASDQPITIAKTINGVTYTKTLTWTGDVCTAVSAWS